MRLVRQLQGVQRVYSDLEIKTPVTADAPTASRLKAISVSTAKNPPPVAVDSSPSASRSEIGARAQRTSDDIAGAIALALCSSRRTREN